MASEAKDLMTVLITSSPTHTHPSTCLLDRVLETFQVVPQLMECRKIIICDGYRVEEKARYKKGRVTQERADCYEQYKLNLRQHIAQKNPIYHNTEILELSTRVGFGFALQAAVPYVTTKYLMIVQHDRSFIKEFNLRLILEGMEMNPALKCVLLPLASTYNYRIRMDTKFSKKDFLGNREIIYKDHVYLPLCQFYDSTHIAHIDFYKDFIFAQKMIPKNGFIEDRLGQIQVRDIRQNGLEVHSKYGTYLFGDGFEYLVQHLDGRDRLSEEDFSWQRDEHGIYKRIMHNIPTKSMEHQTNETNHKMENVTNDIAEGAFSFVFGE